MPVTRPNSYTAPVDATLLALDVAIWRNWACSATRKRSMICYDHIRAMTSTSLHIACRASRRGRGHCRMGMRSQGDIPAPLLASEHQGLVIAPRGAAPHEPGSRHLVTSTDVVYESIFA
jgi:hypothetical protein